MKKNPTGKKILTGALAALTLGGALAAAAAPAWADDHRGGGYRGGPVYRGGGERGERNWRGGNGYGYAAGGALLGLALGATLGGYGAGYAPGYYAYPPAYYDVPRCRIEMRWNPYWGGYDRVRVCY